MSQKIFRIINICLMTLKYMMIVNPLVLSFLQSSQNQICFLIYNLQKNADQKKYCQRCQKRALRDRGISDLPNKQEYKDRLEYELNTFEELGFTDYILLNWEVIGRARESGYPVGDGRGSGAGSLVLFLLGVTNQDPIKHNLFFERFVSKNRAKKITDKHGKDFLVGSLAPDVDSDISHDTRGKVVEFIEEKHKGRTSKILTFNTFSSKLCIKEAAKYFYSIEEEEATKISDMIPKEHGIVMSLKTVSYTHLTLPTNA